MRKMRFSKRAQTIVEYALVISIVIGAFIAAGAYVKRGLSGRWKQSVDDLGDQYDPRYSNADILYTTNVNSVTSITTINAAGGFWSMRQDVSNSLDRKSGFSSVGAYDASKGILY